MSARSKRKAKDHLLWVVESLMEEPSYIAKPMFGCLGIYLHGKLMLVLASGEEPWNGLFIPTEHQFHDAIVKEFNYVVRHTVLIKMAISARSNRGF
jgi:hypothetical protein